MKDYKMVQDVFFHQVCDVIGLFLPYSYDYYYYFSHYGVM